jgi:hypothetical protein
MNTDRWKHGDQFPVLDLVARFEFKTACSLSFELGKTVDRHSPRLPEMEPGEERIDGRDKWDWLLETGSVFVGLGWLDAHHPCDDFHPLRLRVGLPDRYVSWESIRDLVPGVIAALELPPDVQYRVELAGLSEQLCTEVPARGFVSTTRWQPPR